MVLGLVACGGRSSGVDGSGEAGTESGDDTGTQTGGDGDCPEPAGAYADFYLGHLDELEAANLDLVCTYYGVAPIDEKTMLLQFTQCEDQDGGEPLDALELYFSSSAGAEPFIGGGSKVRLRYVQQPPSHGGRWLMVHDESGDVLFLGGFVGSSFFPAEDDFYFTPLDFAIRTVGCEPVADDSGCGLAERLALEAGWGDSTSIIPDGTLGYVGQLTSYAIAVEQFVSYHEISCEDFAVNQLRVAFTMIPEG
jgi:hypothetical protein